MGVISPGISGQSSPTTIMDADGVIVLGLEHGDTPLGLYSADGRLIRSDVLHSQGGRSEHIPTKALAPGIYYLRSGTIGALKFLVR